MNFAQAMYVLCDQISVHPLLQLFSKYRFFGFRALPDYILPLHRSFYRTVISIFTDNYGLEAAALHDV